MQFSKETITILKNCAVLNPTVAFKHGNVIRNITPAKNVLFKAIITETLPQDFQVYQLNRLLNNIAIFDNPYITFSEDYLTISNNNSRIDYYYCHPEILGDTFDLSDKDVVIDNPVVDFIIPSEQIQMMYKVMSTLNLECLRFSTNEKNETILSVIDKQRNKLDNYQYNTHTVANKPFTVDLDFNYVSFTLIPSEYNVKISSEGTVEFYSSEYETTYWVAGS